MNDVGFDVASFTNRTAHSLFGIVSAVDPVNHAVKVRIQPDNLETGWIPDACGVQAGSLRVSHPSSVGTHVVLQPVEGDGEHFVVTGIVFDTVVKPPVSPITGVVAQAGEMLVMAGCGAPPLDGRLAGAPTDGGGWWHITSQGFFGGAGNAGFSIGNDLIRLFSGDVSLELGAGGLKVSGGDVKTDLHSLNEHFHLVGSQKTEGPTG
ncbi:baseplate assembly protein [Gluconobacter wancherniae]|uniref:Baseplate assembly protein n=1 Tax=Gluconobacter wancherniae NBRC 103581 TaxID=656744 RepID=A0A511AZX8_9PROT|nr:baseplate assembly protein [Gluconobacter wancherniae]MBF0854406.1 baseplate assembly protein [Gluconobacter wancherniae]GBD57467.1 hypothetical protein NBRC103581_02055 [Gluconobacter wancherniae NBRC 103581]GBR62712.1 phage-related baseplate assembly protein [Gluconobacter wancherniae NBRC 103581]GEK93759.1 hypothetical protein GWA01_15290 [Gluconobacter wancherniae NBRC 103581]